jgi:hypothetical protein
MGPFEASAHAGGEPAITQIAMDTVACVNVL